MYDNPNSDIFCTIPGWRRVADPEIPGSSVWVHEDYDGKPNRAILATERTADGGYTSISVLANPLVLPGEVDGECLGTFPSWDAAFEFALASLELGDAQ